MKEVKCPKPNCKGTLELFGSRKKYNEDELYNKTVSLYSCSECRTCLEKDEVDKLREGK